MTEIPGTPAQRPSRAPDNGWHAPQACPPAPEVTHAAPPSSEEAPEPIGPVCDTHGDRVSSGASVASPTAVDRDRRPAAGGDLRSPGEEERHDLGAACHTAAAARDLLQQVHEVANGAYLAMPMHIPARKKDEVPDDLPE